MAYSPDSFTAGEVPTTAKWNKLWSNDADFDARITNSAPAGKISGYGGTTAPAGWLMCDGSAVSRTTYASLFAVIGTSYGAGDGSTTFNLPNGKGRNFYGRDSAQTEFDVVGEVGGEKAHYLTVNEMPSHSHTSIDRMMIWDAGKSPLGGIAAGSTAQSSGWGGNVVANNGGGAAHNNLGPYQVIGGFIIKT